MLDPIPPPPEWLREWTRPWAERANLHSLPEHIHEVLLFYLFYQFVHSCASPWLSRKFLPQYYTNLPRRTQINWDTHVVSFIQSTSVVLVALWVMVADKERKAMASDGWEEGHPRRMYGYTGACGLVQAMAVGYFVYDLIVSTVYVRITGVGMVFHAISALTVYALGFRPFLNFYSPTFILYELSSPFLNIHWFLDKVNMTGSKAQWYNGMLLLGSFFSARLVWGLWQSAVVYRDMWMAVRNNLSSSSSVLLPPTVFDEQEEISPATAQVTQFARQINETRLPLWLPAAYVASNLVLNSLNVYWFGLMIEAVRKRFREKKPEVKKTEEKVAAVLEPDVVLDAAETLEKQQGYFEAGDGAELLNNEPEGVSSAVQVDGGNEVKRRTA